MLQALSSKLSLRASITGVLSLAMLMSLVCGLSIQATHAKSAIAATADDVNPVQVGQQAPEFVVKSVDGESFTFDPDNLARPVVLITFRGGWCPYCNMHLSELHTVIPEIASLGVDVLFLSGDRPELLYKSLRNETQADIEGLNYQILSDADLNAAIALGIAFKIPDQAIERRNARGDDISESSMMKQGALPVPAVFAIDTTGTIAFSYVNADYKVRLPAVDLLQVAKDLTKR